jgi:hypothetical protein
MNAIRRHGGPPWTVRPVRPVAPVAFAAHEIRRQVPRQGRAAAFRTFHGRPQRPYDEDVLFGLVVAEYYVAFGNFVVDLHETPARFKVTFEINALSNPRTTEGLIASNNYAATVSRTPALLG